MSIVFRYGYSSNSSRAHARTRLRKVNSPKTNWQTNWEWVMEIETRGRNSIWEWNKKKNRWNAYMKHEKNCKYFLNKMKKKLEGEKEEKDEGGSKKRFTFVYFWIYIIKWLRLKINKAIKFLFLFNLICKRNYGFCLECVCFSKRLIEFQPTEFNVNAMTKWRKRSE